MLSPSNTRTRRGNSLRNSHSPPLGAVHRYQVVAAANPNHSPGSKVAPWLLPWTTPSVPSSTVACCEVVVSGAGSLRPAEVEGSSSCEVAHPDSIRLSLAGKEYRSPQVGRDRL